MVEKGLESHQYTGNIINTLTNNTNNSLNSNFNTINIAKILPCETTEKILESVFDKKESFGEPIDSILNKEFSIESFLKSQEEEDALTDAIYQKENGLLIFPQKKKNCPVPPHLGKIGEQTSRHHKENLIEHISMVVAGVSKDTNNDIPMQLVALLHDAGKKYTTGTNQKGELCFYDHEKLSAYLAATIYRQLGFTKEETEPYVRIIHDHMLPFTERKQKPSKKDKYRELHGDYITDSIVLLNSNDLGIIEEDENNPENKSLKIKLIGEGKDILKKLKTEDFQKK